MDTIKFRVRKSEHDFKAVYIAINGEDFIELVREHESPMCRQEGHPNIAGSYAPMSIADFEKGHAEVLAGTHCKPKLTLLGCECGFPECWPLDAKIAEEGDEVVWSDFEQPHRRGKWDYSTFGPFHFDKTQYQAALKAAGLQDK